MRRKAILSLNRVNMRATEVGLVWVDESVSLPGWELQLELLSLRSAVKLSSWQPITLTPRN